MAICTARYSYKALCMFHLFITTIRRCEYYCCAHFTDEEHGPWRCHCSRMLEWLSLWIAWPMQQTPHLIVPRVPTDYLACTDKSESKQRQSAWGHLHGGLFPKTGWPQHHCGCDNHGHGLGSRPTEMAVSARQLCLFHFPFLRLKLSLSDPWKWFFDSFVK